MYFGTPSPQGKFYKGLSTDTPVNHVRRSPALYALLLRVHSGRACVRCACLTEHAVATV